ncbi:MULTISPECIES: RusA family crossover junction endodeoxyribonuclease [unclassified Mycolicibacterium]|uniref:RusA family crossover junction endodeoxyribonuclease n=1 Tax=unclassified Mycolicibacterium TaxID=2636767 RepID=UPI0012DF6358|nr:MULTISPECIES: RusA family crossover junction endodeoxyribonuclease [unclassified Mycolicibacterium]MUL81309.1 RusA family crossover junction endodeoxyribonuclease [Mycolicibacterium sp. CBMA 329]MUL87075.1 RusA family crossover junction endodeoxyribonuclease [Mycolicibacterium sp. CBMA 331]MUL98643.1 RusA family crossover junction endodeoxyribonuclease [Mycolicibacterium sp. CBMA 334]MUM28506.1 RusA family crossover junction endodeoxyribonuclease [Mycolicibacterium sp. CBMA 295]MUM37372.1 R
MGAKGDAPQTKPHLLLYYSRSQSLDRDCARPRVVEEVDPLGLRYSADDFTVSESVDASHVFIETRLDPPSLQAAAATKKGYRASLAAAVARGTSRCFTHDVAVTLTWIISEERRYQTHIVADLDNVLKPTIDALVGPDSVLIDDNQVQSIEASWHTGTTSHHGGFWLRVDSLGIGNFIPRGGRFVEITPGRCYYVPVAPPEAQRKYVDQLVWMNRERAKWEAAGHTEGELYHLAPQSRPFPRARLARFEVLGPDEFG